MKHPRKSSLHQLARLSALEETGLLDSLPNDVFDRLTRLAARTLPAPISLVSLIAKTRLCLKSSVGLPEPWPSLRETPFTHSFCQHVVTRAAPLVIPDATQHPLVKDSLAIRELGFAAYLGIPVTSSEGYVLGAFSVIDTHPRDWSKEDLSLLTELAAFAMTEVGLRRQERLRERADETLRQQSLMDDLTGLYNRRAMGQFLGEEAERSRRYSHPLGVVMLDLDHFKEVNDRFGHQAGDEVLRHASRVIQETLRTVDRAVRYGGDEFLLLLPETDRAAAYALVKRLRVAHDLSSSEFDGALETISFSVGVASMPEDATSTEDLVKAADEALYEMKRRGDVERLE